MRDTTNDIWNDNDGEEEEAPRKGGRLRRFGIFFLILAAVLAVVIVAAYRDGTGFDALQRLFSYGGGRRRGGGPATTTTPPTTTASRCWAAPWWSCRTQSSRSWGRTARRSGPPPVRMSAPALATGGGRAVAYDVGGTELYVVDEDGEVLTLTAPEDAPISPPG